MRTFYPQWRKDSCPALREARRTDAAIDLVNQYADAVEERYQDGCILH